MRSLSCRRLAWRIAFSGWISPLWRLRLIDSILQKQYLLSMQFILDLQISFNLSFNIIYFNLQAQVLIFDDKSLFLKLTWNMFQFFIFLCELSFNNLPLVPFFIVPIFPFFSSFVKVWSLLICLSFCLLHFSLTFISTLIKFFL